jgi:predicted lysophospholipase L1 biosynthesis ABC-type transport system permease subunit
MSKTFVYLILGLIGAIATIIFVQNLEQRLPIKFLGFASFPLPVGLSMLIFLGVGATVALPLNWLIMSAVELGADRQDTSEPEVIDVDYIE